MSWTVLEHPEFAVEREELDSEVAEKLDALILLLVDLHFKLGLGQFLEKRYTSIETFAA